MSHRGLIAGKVCQERRELGLGEMQGALNQRGQWGGWRNKHFWDGCEQRCMGHYGYYKADRQEPGLQKQRLEDREVRNSSYSRLKTVPGVAREKGKAGRNKGHMRL